MKFKFLNVSINLPDSTNVEDALQLESKVKDFVTGLGFPGTISFDNMDDFNQPQKADAPKA